MAHDHRMKKIGEPLRNTHAREKPAGIHIINDDGSMTPLGSGSTPGGIIGNAIVNSVNHHKTSSSPEENERRYGPGAHEHIQQGHFPLQLPTGNGGQGIMWLDEV